MKLRGFRIEPGEIEAALLAAGRVLRRLRWWRARTVAGLGGGLVGYVVGSAGGCGAGRCCAGWCGASCGAVAAAAGPHGAVCDRGSGASAADAERQARPSRAACAGGSGRGGRPRCRARRRRRSCAGCLRRCWGSSGSGIDDNFFELGGDSIVSIQLVSRARRAGLVLTPRAVFQHQTVAGLGGGGGGRRRRARVWRRVVAAMSRSAACRRRRSCAGCGARRPDRSVQPGDSAAGAGGAAARRIWRRRCRRCSIITMRCGCGLLRRRRGVAPGGGAGGGGCGGGLCCGGSMLAGLDEAALRGVLAAEAAAAALRLSPWSGVMVQAVWFDAGAERAGRLLLIDPSSWRWTGCRGGSWCRTWRRRGRRWRAARALSLPARGTSLRRLGAAACVSQAQERERGGGAFVLAGDAEPAVAVAG